MLSSIHKRIAYASATATVALWALGGTLWPAAALAVPESSDPCPNAEVRALQSAAYLPDCRAYELVSPADKSGNNVAVWPTSTQSAVGGNAIEWTSPGVFGDALIEGHGAEYVSQRGAEGWWTHGVNPGQPGIPSLANTSQYMYFSDDLTRGVYWAQSALPGGPQNVEHVANLYLRTDVLSQPPGTYELLSDSLEPLPPRPLNSGEQEANFAAASTDSSHILFEDPHDLTPNSVGTNPEMIKLYEWHNGAVTLAGILPDGTAAEGSIAGSGAGRSSKGLTQDAMSRDGTRVVFTAPPFDESAGNDQRICGNVYMRIDGSETIPVNVDERSEPDPTGPHGACLWAATPDESKLFFTSRQALTNDATPSVSLPWVHYYMYDANAPAGKHLTLLVQSEGQAGPFPGIIGIGADGSYVYFTSPPILEGDPETGGIYVWHDGAVRFIAGHQEQFNSNDLGTFGRAQAVSFRVTPDGKTATFLDEDPNDALRTGYDSELTQSTSAQEIMFYSYDANKLTCASCDPSGASPAGNAGNNAAFEVEMVDSFPGQIAHNLYENRTLSDDGRYLFFDTPDPLVPQDTNGRRDVYEYDTALGRAELLSGGTCNCDSAFVDATPDGSNAFFVTHQSLVRSDVDTAGDLYDARSGGGFVAQSRALPGPCEGDDCQGSAKAAPQFSAPSSAAFAGAGNPVGTTAAPLGRHRLTRAQKLARALRACRVKRRKHRVTCEAQARRRYGVPGRSVKRATRRAGR